MYLQEFIDVPTANYRWPTGNSGCTFYAKASCKNKNKTKQNKEKPESFNPEHESHELHELHALDLRSLATEGTQECCTVFFIREICEIRVRLLRVRYCRLQSNSSYSSCDEILIGWHFSQLARKNLLRCCVLRCCEFAISEQLQKSKYNIIIFCGRIRPKTQRETTQQRNIRKFYNYLIMSKVIKKSKGTVSHYSDD